MAIHFTFSNTGKNQFGKTFDNPAPFPIGFSTSYLGNLGLMHSKLIDGCVYKPEEYTEEHGFWAHFIYPTSICESQGSFLCLNTYDRAKFTFTFMQYAAHVPNGDFVKYFRELLKLPLASEYFLNWHLKIGRLC
ncbi:MAG: hypothetical protein IPN76_16030 [Saprospiraceae bacterium]|nr:hypothetical protein [Saprospiraceae bacterium]